MDTLLFTKENANFHLNTMKINAIYHASTLQRQLTMWRTWRAHNRKQNRVNHRTPIHLLIWMTNWINI